MSDTETAMLKARTDPNTRNHLNMSNLLHNKKGFSTVEVILVLLAAVLIGAVGWFIYHDHQMKVTTYTPGVSSGDAKFTGTVTKNCSDASIPAGDVGCYITVGSISVQISPGNLRTSQPWGSIAKDSYAHGEKVAVYAHKIDNNHYTLEGSSKYYIRPLD
jgi:hypothetical protein